MKRRKFVNHATIAGLSFSGFHLLNSCETEIKNNNQTYMGGFKANPIREIKAAFVVLEIEGESMQETLIVFKELIVGVLIYMKLGLRKL